MNKKDINYIGTSNPDWHYRKDGGESLILNYGCVVVSSVDIKWKYGAIHKSDLFTLIKAFKKESRVFIQIEKDNFTDEVSFKIPKNNKIKNKKQLRRFLDSFIYRVVAVIEH